MLAINHVPLIDIAESKTGCCTLIRPLEWDGKTFEFEDKLFAKASTRNFLHIPLNIDSVMTRAQAAIDQADAAAEDWLILSKEVSPWRTEHYFAVTKPVPGLETEKLSGTFMTKVFEGSFREAGKWYGQLIEAVKKRGKQASETYFFYMTCPNCAKIYGKNYVVGFARIE